MSRKKFFSFLFVFLFCVVYTTSPAEAKDLGYRWHKSNVYFNSDFSSSQRTAIQSAMSKWNAVKTSDGDPMVTFHLTTSTADNSINYINNYKSWVGYCSVTKSGTNLVAVQIWLDSGYQWSTSAQSGKYDIQTVVQHELGHALGIAHCHEWAEDGYGPCWSYTCLSNVMYPVARTNYRNVTLSDYDIASYQLIYEMGRVP